MALIECESINYNNLSDATYEFILKMKRASVKDIGGSTGRGSKETIKHDIPWIRIIPPRNKYPDQFFKRIEDLINFNKNIDCSRMGIILVEDEWGYYLPHLYINT